MIGTMLAPVVVLEATSAVGDGVVAAALGLRWPVVAVDPDAVALKKLAVRHAHAALTLLPGSARDETAAAELAVALRSLGRPLSGVIAVHDSGLLRGRLLDLTADASCSQFDAALAPQLAAARHLLPLLAEGARGGGYVLIGGPGGVHPWAGYGHSSVTEAALRMLARVLHCEARQLGVRVQLLSLDTPAWGVHVGQPRAHWPSALEIGRHALELLVPGAPADAVIEFGNRRAAPPGNSALYSNGSAADTTPAPPDFASNKSPREVSP